MEGAMEALKNLSGRRSVVVYGLIVCLIATIQLGCGDTPDSQAKDSDTNNVHAGNNSSDNDDDENPNEHRDVNNSQPANNISDSDPAWTINAMQAAPHAVDGEDVEQLSFLLGPGDQPVVSFVTSRFAGSQQWEYTVHVLKWVDDAWQALGEPYVGDVSAGALTMILDSAGMPTIAFAESPPQFGERKPRLFVKEWSGSAWETLRDESAEDFIEAGVNAIPSLKLSRDEDGSLYLASFVRGVFDGVPEQGGMRNGIASLERFQADGSWSLEASIDSTTMGPHIAGVVLDARKNDVIFGYYDKTEIQLYRHTSSGAQEFEAVRVARRGSTSPGGSTGDIHSVRVVPSPDGVRHLSVIFSGTTMTGTTSERRRYFHRALVVSDDSVDLLYRAQELGMTSTQYGDVLDVRHSSMVVPSDNRPTFVATSNDLKGLNIWKYDPYYVGCQRETMMPDDGGCYGRYTSSPLIEVDYENEDETTIEGIGLMLSADETILMVWLQQEDDESVELHFGQVVPAN